MLVVHRGSCTDSVLKEFDIKDVTPKLSVKYSGCYDATLSSNLDTMLDSSISYYWVPGDNSANLNGLHPKHTYPGDGSYVATLVVKQNSCTRNFSEPVAFKHNQLVFSTDNQQACTKLPVNFTITSSVEPWDTLKWETGDGHTYLVPSYNFSHRYTDTGTYIVKLSSANYPCELPYLMKVIVTKPELGTIAPQAVCAGSTASFQALAIAGPQGETFKWNFGDGSKANGSDVTHTYKDSGTYTVTLISSDPCKDTVTRNIHIVRMQADLPISGSSQVYLGDTANYTIPLIKGLKYNWSVEPSPYVLNGGETQVNILFDGKDTGARTIYCTYTNGLCTTTISKTVDIIARPDAVKEMKAADGQLAVFPNPTTGEITLSIDNTQNGFYNLQLMDISGKVLSESTEHFITGKISSTLSLRMFPAGVYYLKLSGNNGMMMQKIIKN
jgi:PKD repeat protein